MTSPAASAADRDPDAERALRHGRLLQELAEIGMELARDLRDQARAPAQAPTDDDAPPRRPSPAEIAMAFARISRAVRLTLLLETRVAEARAMRALDDPDARRARERTGLAARADASFAALPPAERRRDVLRAVVPYMVETALEQAPWRLGAEPYERCESLIAEGLSDRQMLERPIPELIALVCAELGIAPDWRQWTPQSWTTDGLHALGPDDLLPKPAEDAAPPNAASPAPTPLRAGEAPSASPEPARPPAPA